MIGVAKRDGVVDVAMLEHCVRDVLNRERVARGSPSCARSRS